MKFCNISLLFVLFALICSISYTLAQEDAVGQKRIPLRRPVGGKAAKSTTTAAPSPAYDEDGDYQDGENHDGEPAEESDEAAAVPSTSTTSTEAPKKIGPVIRPFRSNDDFLNSLKRRQMNAKKHLSEKPTPKSRPAPAAEHGDEAEESAPAAAAPALPSKGFKGNSALNRRKLVKPSKPEHVDDAAAEESEHQKEESKLKRPSNARLALRKRV